MKKLKLWSSDLKILFKNAEGYTDKNELITILRKIEHDKNLKRDFYEFELTDEERDVISNFLGSLIGVGEDGETDAVGRFAERLEDELNIYSE